MEVSTVKENIQIAQILSYEIWTSKTQKFNNFSDMPDRRGKEFTYPDNCKTG